MSLWSMPNKYAKMAMSGKGKMSKPPRHVEKPRYKRLMGDEPKKPTRRKATEKEKIVPGVGARLRWVRELVGITQAELAAELSAELKINQTQWSRWEKDKRPAPPHIMIVVCNRLQISMDYIYRGYLLGVHPDLAERLLKAHPGELMPPPRYTGWHKGKDQP